ncbi:hypothetical protein ACJJTC_017661 [Scirpophaga incertulas]
MALAASVYSAFVMARATILFVLITVAHILAVAYAAPAEKQPVEQKRAAEPQKEDLLVDDLKPAASHWGGGWGGWGGNYGGWGGHYGGYYPYYGSYWGWPSYGYGYGYGWPYGGYYGHHGYWW